MRNDTVERVTDWESEPFNDGHDGLRELADREFTGAATDGHAWLFMLNGRVLGVFDGDVETFESADGTAYTAPDPALPLLFAMQETGGETRAEYYTEDTAIADVDRKLQSGNFTGYVELSENVLSGDYYVAYYGGRRLPAAFVGNSSELLTGDDAFERADDEVGIYQVNTVDLEITDVPEPEPEATSAVGETDSAPSLEESEPEPVEATPASEASEPEAPAAPDELETDTPPATATSRSEPASTRTEPGRGDASSEQSDPSSEEPDVTESEPAAPTEPADASTVETKRKPVEPREPETNEPEAEPATPGERATEQWHGAQTIPALNPGESVDMEEAVDGDIEPEPAGATAEPAPASPDTQVVQELEAERDRLQERLEELETETERLEGETGRLERERDEARTKVTELEQEVEELRATVDRLESELASAEQDLAAAEEYVPEGDHEVAPEHALDGTNLFVRYDRQGGPTLEDTQSGNVAREEVNENLRLEHHTEFEDDGAIVGGQPFAEWLQGTIEYGFARWLVGSFVHDIRETRNQSSLGKLYDAIPEIDRVEFRGEVELDAADDGDIPDSARFDVVLRDRMGSPLLVADLNDAREPATESMLGTLIENATPVARVRDDLAAAFFVTTSYYEPGALETAEEATGGGFLSRDKQKSFVKFSRKSGYHLCLVETREREFHVSVPEL